MKIEVKYGLYTGLGICLWKMAEHFLGFNTTRLDIGQFTRVFGILLPIVMIVLGIREKRNVDFHGELLLYDGIRCGMTIALVYGAVTAVFFLIYQSYINPGYLTYLIAFERNRMIGDGIPEAEILAKVDAMRTMNSFPALLVFQFVGSMISGLAISIIGSGVLKKKSAMR